jgi:hypothetical protein
VPATGAVRGTQLRRSLYVTRSLVLKQPASPPVAILDSPAKQRNRQAVGLMQPAQRAGFFWTGYWEHCWSFASMIPILTSKSLPSGIPVVTILRQSSTPQSKPRCVSFPQSGRSRRRRPHVVLREALNAVVVYDLRMTCAGCGGCI